MDNAAICMISTYYHPHIGGAEKQIERLGEWLVNEGREVMVITRHLPNTHRFEVRNGIRIYRTPVLPGKMLSALSFVLFGLWVMLRQRHRYDLIHSHQVFSPTTIGLIASKLFKKPLLVNLHRGGNLGDLDKLLRHAPGQYRFKLMKQQADFFIAISREIYQELREQNIPDSQIIVLPNSVDTGTFKPVSQEEKKSICRQLQLPLDKPIVVYIGRLVPEKGLDILLDAWQAVSEDAYLLIVGKGELEDTIRRRVHRDYQHSVFIAGPQTNVIPYLQASDIWTLPSRTEGLPLSLLEAMACGLPVIVTCVGGIPDIIESGENGILIMPDDVDTLAYHLQKAIRLDEDTLRLGKKARQMVLKSYDTRVSAQKYDDLYQSLLKSHLET